MSSKQLGTKRRRTSQQCSIVFQHPSTAAEGIFSDDAMTLVHLSEDLLVVVLSYLGWKEALLSRVCKLLKEVSLVTPIVDQMVFSRTKPDILQVPFALPLLESIALDYFTLLPAEIKQIQQLRHVRNLDILGDPTNPGEPRHFFSFHSLQSINIQGHVSELNLSDFTRWPNLKRIKCSYLRSLEGDLKSLQDLQEVLEELALTECIRITGSVMSLADFPSLRTLYLDGCRSIVGDIREIKPHHFPSLKTLSLQQTSIDSHGFETINEADAFYAAWRNLLRRSRPISRINYLFIKLCDEAPECYHPPRFVAPIQYPPLYTKTVLAGPRFGYRWVNRFNMTCDIIWLDQEPNSTDKRYEEYRNVVDKLEKELRGSIYRCYKRPPSEEEWRQIARVR